MSALFTEQSIRGAAGGAALAAVLLTVIWVVASVRFDQFFPWFSVVEGIFIGRAVRRFGFGIDWRFPSIAATVTIVAAFVGSFLSALFLTGREFYTPVIELIAEVNWHTIVTFATVTFGEVGTIYAISGAILAAFFANRKLGRNEAIALRKYREARK